LPEVVLSVDNFISGELDEWVQAQFRLTS
jgi:hypothetical protein